MPAPGRATDGPRHAARGAARASHAAKSLWRARGVIIIAHSALRSAVALTRVSPLSQFLGWYNPLKKETQLDGPAIKKWLDQGAQPTETVANLLRKAMIIQQVGPKRVYNQLSSKAAAAAKAEKAAIIKKAQTAKADKLKAKVAAEAAAAKVKAAEAKAAAAAAAAPAA